MQNPWDVLNEIHTDAIPFPVKVKILVLLMKSVSNLTVQILQPFT